MQVIYKFSVFCVLINSLGWSLEIPAPSEDLLTVTQLWFSHLSVRDDSGGIRVARQADWGPLGHDVIFVLDNLELVAAKELIFFLKRSHQFWRCLLIKCNGRAAVLGEGASTLSRASMLQRFGWNHRNTPIKYIFMF